MVEHRLLIDRGELIREQRGFGLTAREMDELERLILSESVALFRRLGCGAPKPPLGPEWGGEQ